MSTAWSSSVCLLVRIVCREHERFPGPSLTLTLDSLHTQNKQTLQSCFFNRFCTLLWVHTQKNLSSIVFTIIISGIVCNIKLKGEALRLEGSFSNKKRTFSHCSITKKGSLSVTGARVRSPFPRPRVLQCLFKFSKLLPRVCKSIYSSDICMALYLHEPRHILYEWTSHIFYIEP